MDRHQTVDLMTFQEARGISLLWYDSHSETSLFDSKGMFLSPIQIIRFVVVVAQLRYFSLDLLETGFVHVW